FYAARIGLYRGNRTYRLSAEQTHLMLNTFRLLRLHTRQNHISPDLSDPIPIKHFAALLRPFYHLLYELIIPIFALPFRYVQPMAASMHAWEFVAKYQNLRLHHLYAPSNVNTYANAWPQNPCADLKNASRYAAYADR